MKKIVALLLAMMFVIGVLAACSPSAPTQTTQDPTPTEDPGTGSALIIPASTFLTMLTAPLPTLPPIA